MNPEQMTEEMTKLKHAVTIRLDDNLIHLVEKVRDPQKYPTLSDFVRRAVEQYARKIKRHQLAAECRNLVNEDLTPLTEFDLPDYAERMAQAERGDL